ncbi:MAG: glutathione S-transferase N-terminal domain-containing protein [Pseudomonadales bacterium]
MNKTKASEYVMYGLDCSYFTGKLEAYFKNTGLPYRYVEMTTDDFDTCSAATGVKQLPCVQTPEGEWLTDTTAIIEHLEKQGLGLNIRPQDPTTAFCGLLLEDLFDEWFWRPALYYRWHFKEDSRLMSRWIARTYLRNKRAPLFLRQWFMLIRQRIVYLKKDGVNKTTAPAIEALYLDSLRALDSIFATRPFLFGDRPCEADYGLFGPFFRHFFCDPTPGALMREHAPYVAQWVTRLWASRPANIDKAKPLEAVPQDLGFFFDMVSNDYLPYMVANAQALTSGEKLVRYRSLGVDWEVPTAPYRAQCLNKLKQDFAELDSNSVNQLAELLSAEALHTLGDSLTPIETGRATSVLPGRLGRPAHIFD